MMRTCIFLLGFFGLLLPVVSLKAQCPNNADRQFVMQTYGAPPCGTFDERTTTSYSANLFNVVAGGVYQVSTCNTAGNPDLLVTVYDNAAGTVQAFNDDNGPLCNSLKASVEFTANFTGTAKALVNPWRTGFISNCHTNPTNQTNPLTVTSVILGIRQINNIQITNPNTICSGTTGAITATPAGGTLTVLDGSGTVTGTAPNFTFSPAIGFTGQADLRYTFGGCATDFAFGVAPTYVRQNITSTGALTYCGTAASVSLNANSNPGPGITPTVEWFFTDAPALPQDGGATSIGTGNTVNTPAGATVTRRYQYFVSNTFCNDGWSPNFIEVVVNPLPNVSITNTTPSICLGQTTSTLSVDPALSNVSWLPTAGLSGGGFGNSVVASPTITTVYTVTATGANGCTNTATTTVVVNTPPAQPSFTGSAFCASANETYTVVTPNPLLTYSWNVSLLDAFGTAIPLQTGTGTSINVDWSSGLNVNSFGRVELTATDANGCVSPVRSIDIGLRPVATLQALPAELCGTGNVIWTATGPAGAEFQFTSTTGGFQAFSANSTYNQTISAGVSVTVRARTNDGNGNFCFSQDVTVAVPSTPLPVVNSVSANPPFPVGGICQGANNVFDLSAVGTVNSPNNPQFVFFLGASPATGTILATVPGVPQGAGVFNATAPGIALTNGNVVNVVIQNPTPSGTLTCESAILAFPAFVVNLPPANNLLLNGSTVCNGVSATVTVQGSENGISYQLLSGGNPVAGSSAVIGNGGNILLTVPVTAYAVGANTFGVRATNPNTGCTVDLVNTATVTVTPAPVLSLGVTGSTLCEGQSGTVTVVGSEVGVDYEIRNSGNVLVAGPAPGTGADLSFTIPAGQLAVGANTFTVRATLTSNGCVLPLNQTATITVNPVPNLTLTLVGSTICLGQDGQITVQNSQVGVIYTAADGGGNPIVGTETGGTGGNITLTVPAASLTTVGPNTLNVIAGQASTGCSAQLVSPVIIQVQAVPTLTLSATGNTVCETFNGQIQVANTQNGVDYQVFQGANPVGAVQAGFGGTLTFTIPAANLVVGANIFDVRATFQSTGCGANVQTPATVTVNPLPDVTFASAGNSVCLGVDGTITIPVSGTGFSYQALSGGNPVGAAVAGTGASIDLTIPSGSLVVGPNNFTIRVTNTGTGCVNTTTVPTVVTVQQAPVLTLVPVGSTVCEGSDGTITIPNSELGVTYQAFQGGNPVSGLVAGTGANVTITVPAANLVVGSNSFSITATLQGNGCAAPLNAAVAIIVNAVPVINPTVQGNTVCETFDGQIQVLASQNGLDYQVFQGANPVGAAQAGFGGTLTFTIPAANLVVGANTFDVRATFQVTGCGANVQTPATVTVNPLPDVTFASAGNSVCLGVDGTITIPVSATGFSYQALAGGNPVGAAVAGTGGSIGLTIPGASLVVGANNFTIRVTNTGTGCVNTTTIPTVVTVQQAPVLTLTVSGSTVCAGQNGTITVQASEIGVDYQVLQNGNPVGNIVAGTGANITLTVPAANLVVGSNPFTINATLQANSCASPLNAGTTIIVNPIPNITLTLNGSTVCQNQNGTVTVVNSEAGVNYEPFIGGVSVGAAVAGTGGSITLTIPAANLVLGSNTITVNANSTISGCSAAASATATVVVNPLPSVTINANGSTVCDGQSALVTITNSDPNASYTLVNASSVVVAGPVNGTGAQINLTVPAANLAVGTNNFTVTATITATGCSANGTTPAVITVNPIPSTSVTLAGSTVCQGQDGTVTITNSQNGVVYQMFQGGNPVSPTVNGNGANITLTIPAAQLTVGTNTFNVQATIGATGCSSTANSTVNVVVNPFPPLTLTLSNNSPVCDLQNATVTVQASTPGVSYQLTQNGNPIGVPVNGTGANIDLTVPDANLLVGTNTFTVTATVTATGCTSNLTQTTTITVLPVPSVSLTVNGNTVCDGQSGIITIQNSEPTATYSAVDINNNVIGGPVTGTGANISIPVPAGSLVVGGNTFTVTATSTINNCVGPLTQQATITVNPLPQINLNLPPQTACQGSDGQVLVQASQTNTLYELFQGPTPIGAPVPGTGGDIGLPVPAVNLVVGINTFTVRATNITSGCQSNLTATATIDVIALPTVSFTVTGNTVCDLQNGELTISSTLLNVNYQVSQNGNPIGNPVAGTGGALTLVVPDADLNVGANVFTVTVTLPNSGCFVTSTASGTITVNPLPIDLVATAVPVCVNQSAQVVINNSQPGVAYTVLDATNTVIAGPVNGNGTSALLSVPAANLVAGVNTFNVRAENTLTTCAILFATPLSITVNPLPSSALVVTDVTVCEGSPAVFQVQNPQAGVDYTLINAGGAAVASTSAVNGTNLDITVQPAQLNVGANVFTVVATFTATGCSANLLDQPTITVTPLPVLSVALTGSTVCEGVDGTITVQASQVGVDYQAIIGGNPVGGSVAGTGADITLTVPAASLVVGANTVSVNATLTATGCAANATSTATITVIQAPVFNPQTVVNDFTACEGVDIPYPIELTEVGRSYEIYLGTTLVGGPYAGTGGNIIATIPSGNLLVGANAITVRIINPATQCASTQTASINRTITVVANPSVTIAILEPQPIAVCQNVDGQFTLVNAAANTTYQLFAGTTPIGAPVAGTGGNLVIPVDAADLPQVGLNTFSIVAVSTAPGGCSSTLNTTVTFDVLPEPNITPIVTAPASGNVCFGTGATIGVNPSQLGIDYTPFINGVAVGQAVTGNGGLILLNVDQPFLNAVGTYTVEIRAVNTVTQCGSVLSATTTLNVVAVPAGIVASGRPTCAGNDGVIIIGDLADNTVNSVLGWRYFVYSQSQPGAPVAQEDGTNGDLELTIPGAFLLNPTEAFDIYAVDIATGCTSAVALTVTIQVNLRPSNLITVDGSRICFGGDGEIYLGNVDPLNPSLFSAANTSYQLLDSLNNPIGLPQVGTGTSGLLTFTVPGAPNPRYLLGINRYRFVATDLTTLCTDTLLGIGLLEVFSTPEFEPIAQSVVCQYADEFEVVINQPVGNLTYSLFDIPTGVTLGTPVVSQLGQQSLTLTALVTDISATRTPGVYTVGVRAVSAPNTLTNCQNETSASVRILAAPVVPVDSVAATDVCLGNTGTIRLFATLFPGHLYRIYNADGSQVLFDTLGTSGNVTITMPASVYTVPSTTFNVVVLNTVTGCESAPVPVTVDVFNLPNTIFEPQVVTNPVCEGGPITIRLVNGSGVGTSYQVFNNTTNRPVGDPVLGTGDPIEFTIPFTQSGDVVPGVNELKVIASNPASNCSADLATTVTLNVNPLPDTTLVLTPNVVCQGTGRNGEIIVVNSTTGVSYVVVNATGTPVSDAVPGGGDITLIVPFVNLAPGDNVFSVRATITATGCVATFPATVNIRMTTEAASPTLATTAPICEGSTATIIVTNPSAFQYLLFATENGGTPIAVSDNSGILISTPLLTDTTLWVEARNESCTGSARTPIVIDVVPLPQADFILKTDTNFYKLVVPNAVVEFRNLSRDADSVRWFFGDDSVSTEREPKHTYADSGRYTVTLVVFNELGCTDTLRVGPFIVQAGIRALSLPNAFSPNNDFNNDQFVTIPVGYDSYCIYIYDRWGREVFNNNCEFLKYWDGRDKDQNACPEGVYVYRLTGTVKGQVVKEVSGTVTLVR